MMITMMVAATTTDAIEVSEDIVVIIIRMRMMIIMRMRMMFYGITEIGAVATAVLIVTTTISISRVVEGRMVLDGMSAIVMMM